MRRHFAGGQGCAAILIRTSSHPARARAFIVLKAIVQLLLVPVAALALMRQPAPGRSVAIHVAGILGKLFSSRLYPLYRAEERARAIAAG